MFSRFFEALNAGYLSKIFFLIGVSAIGFAYYMEHLHNLPPCVLCIYQRWVYFFIIFLSVLLFVIDKQGKKGSKTIMFIFFLTFFVGSVISLYHIGVEKNWWAGTESCAANGDFGNADVDTLRKGLLQKSIPRCDEVLWSLFGISMAGYNFILSFLLSIFSLRYFKTMRNGSRKS